MRGNFRVISCVQKTHGRSGEVVTVPVHGLPFLVEEGMRVAVVPPALTGDRWHTVTSVQEDDRLGQLVALSGVDSLDDSELLVGRYLLASVDELPDDLDLHDPDRLVGREVVDAATGATGAIAEVMRGPLGEVLLPVVDEVVDAVPEQGPIPVRVPAGLGWELPGGDAR